MKMEITVIIPTYNRCELLERALKSVLNQTYPLLKIIVCDNCSTDRTFARMSEIEDDRVRYYKNEKNIGMIANWKKAIFEKIDTDWFIIMSDDDYFVDFNYINEVADVLRNNDVKAVIGGAITVDETNSTQEELKYPFEGLVNGYKLFSLYGSIKPQDIALCSIAFNKKDAIRLNFLSNPNNLSADSEFYLKLCCEGSIYIINKPVCVYTKHASNLTNKIAKNKNLMIGNLEHLIAPFEYSIKKEINAKIRSQFISNSKIIDAIAGALLVLKLNDKKEYNSYLVYLSQISPELNRLVLSSAKYKIKIFFFILYRIVYFRKYKFKNN